MLPLVKLLDTTFGVCVGHEHPISVSGIVIGSQGKIIIDGLPAAVIMDTVIAGCGHTGTIVSGSGKVFVGGLPAARLGDSFVGTYSGTITSGSGKILSI